MLLRKFMLPAFLINSIVAIAADWNSCAEDLDRLQQSARYAIDMVEQVKPKASDLEDCRNYLNAFDHMGDKCQSLTSDYEKAVRRLQSELATTDRRVRDVSNSCGVDLGGERGAQGTKSLAAQREAEIAEGRDAHSTKQSKDNRHCELYRSYKGKLPIETLMQTCSKSMLEDECKKCLLTD